MAQDSAGITTRVSIGLNGLQGNRNALNPALSANGRFVAFVSEATNLVAGDTNGVNDIFIHDRQTSITSRVSVSSDGAEANGASYEPTLSDDGRFVAFYSHASNLVAGDTNVSPDIFVHNRETGVTSLVSVNSDGIQGNRPSFYPALSVDGRFVAFSSQSTNLVAEDTNGIDDVFIHDRQTGVTSIISVNSWGTQGNHSSFDPTLSADGRYVAFCSLASNFAADANSTYDIFVHNRQTGVTSRVSVSSDGTPGNFGSEDPVISADGRYIAFSSRASNFIAGDNNNTYDIFVRDLQTGITSIVSSNSDGVMGNGTSGYPALSGDGRFVAFSSSASNLIAEDKNSSNDVFVHDRQTGITSIVSVSSDGIEGNDYSRDTAMSADGRRVAFESWASNLVEGDSNGLSDIFVHETMTPVYLSPTGKGTVSGKAFTNADILSYVKTTNSWDILYDGSTIKTTKNVGAFALVGDDILLGFSAAQVVPGLGTTKVAPQDLVRFTPTSTGYNNTAGTFIWLFDGSDVGLSTNGEIIDALWIDAQGRLYISTAGAGEVPANSANPTGAKIKFQDEDVLRFTPDSTGATTAGAWELYWDPTLMTGVSAEDINGYWEDPATGDRYVTILGAFNVGNTAYGGKFAGNGKTILRFAPNAAAPGGWAPADKVTWLAAGATFPSNLDGIEMAR